MYRRARFKAGKKRRRQFIADPIRLSPSSVPRLAISRFRKDPLQTAASGLGHSGFGHSGHGGHSGFGHSGHGHHSGYGHHESYGHESHGYGHYDCCPLVVDPLTYLAILGFLAAATYLLETVVQMSMLGRRRKRSLDQTIKEVFFEGKPRIQLLFY